MVGKLRRALSLFFSRFDAIRDELIFTLDVASSVSLA